MPTNRPDLPRASSAMSGFFFCGMIDDPVAQASSSAPSRTRSTSRADLLAQPGEVDADQRARRSRTRRRSRGRGRASIELSAARSKPSSAATASGSSGSESRPARPAPSGLTARPPVPVVQPVDVARRTRARGRAAGGRTAPAGRAAGASCRARRRPAYRSASPSSAYSSAATARASERPDVVPQVQPEVGGDLVVAVRPARSLPPSAPSLSVSPRSSACARPRRSRSARTCPSATSADSSVSAPTMRGELVVGEQPGPVQHPGVRPGRRPGRRARAASRSASTCDSAASAGGRGRRRSGRPTAGSGSVSHAVTSRSPLVAGARPAWRHAPQLRRSPWPGPGRRCRRCRRWPG